MFWVTDDGGHVATVSLEFLTRLGVRRVTTVQPLIVQLRDTPNRASFVALIDELASQWEELSRGDKDAIMKDIKNVPALQDGSSTKAVKPAKDVCLPDGIVGLGPNTGIWILDVPLGYAAEDSNQSKVLHRYVWWPVCLSVWCVYSLGTVCGVVRTSCHWCVVVVLSCRIVVVLS